MPKYLFEVRYTAEGARGLLREGGRGRLLDASTLESFYFALGDVDLYAIGKAPDNATAAAAALAIDQAGAATVKTIALIEAQEMDAVVRKNADYRPPGQ
jgi:uncharacterized protein with GYD domain